MAAAAAAAEAGLPPSLAPLISEQRLLALGFQQASASSRSRACCSAGSILLQGLFFTGSSVDWSQGFLRMASLLRCAGHAVCNSGSTLMSDWYASAPLLDVEYH